MSQPRRDVTRLVLGYGICEAWKKTRGGRSSTYQSAGPGGIRAEILWEDTFPFDHPSFRILMTSGGTTPRASILAASLVQFVSRELMYVGRVIEAAKARSGAGLLEPPVPSW
jgi:hypothetical protein